MSGRKKHPNSPNATHAIRISDRAFRKLKTMREGEEPYGWTFERALNIRKKEGPLEQDKGQERDGYLCLNNANEELIKMLKKRDAEIEQLKSQRKAMHALQI